MPVKADGFSAASWRSPVSPETVKHKGNNSPEPDQGHGGDMTLEKIWNIQCCIIMQHSKIQIQNLNADAISKGVT